MAEGLGCSPCIAGKEIAVVERDIGRAELKKERGESVDRSLSDDLRCAQESGDKASRV